MNMLYAFLYGAVLALGLIVPLGVQNIFIFNQGANQKHFLNALPSVFAATICDAILIICAVLGISVIVLTIPWLKTLIFAAGFCFLIYIGTVTWRSKPHHLQEGKRPISAKKQVMFAVSVSLLNPHALLDTIGIIGTSSLGFFGKEKVMFTFACIFISACWFFSLSVMGHFCIKLISRAVDLLLLIKYQLLLSG